MWIRAKIYRNNENIEVLEEFSSLKESINYIKNNTLEYAISFQHDIQKYLKCGVYNIDNNQFHAFYYIIDVEKTLLKDTISKGDKYEQIRAFLKSLLRNKMIENIYNET